MNKFKEFFGITPIGSNPIGWARKVGQSRAKVIFWILIHIAFVTFGIWSIYFLSGKIQNENFFNPAINNQLKIMVMIPAIGTMFFIGVLYPAFYLYAIYRLLQEIDKRDKTLPSRSPLE